jgi:hypothetical protein
MAATDTFLSTDSLRTKGAKSMRKLQWLLLIAAVIFGKGCTCSNAINGGENPDGMAGMGLTVLPATVTLNVTIGGTIPTQTFTATDLAGMDVSTSAVWSVGDPTLGTFNGNVFTPSAIHGGTTTVTATYQGESGTATLIVVLHADITTTTCPGCPAFPPNSAPACTSMSRNPAVLYPPDNTLVPPNMNVIETQFDQGMGNTLFEIDFENAVTDVRVETQCNAITDTKGLATNGCAYDLSQTVWDYIAQTNAGGEPLMISVRATDSTQSCVATSSSTNILFAEQPLNGGIYYWQSVVIGGVQGAAGGVFTYNFGVPNQAPNPFLTPSGSSNKCVGCHFLSRDGLKMTYGSDDADADDEYGDLRPQLLDVTTKTVPMMMPMLPPGFQTFSPDHSVFLASDGRDMNNPPAFYLFNSTTGAAGSPATVPSGGLRGTQPDWSPDGTSIVFVQVPSGDFFSNMGGTSTNGDDEHFYHGSLFTMSYNSAAQTFGSPTALLGSQGENNYYPAYSPDNKFVIFNRAPATQPLLSQDAFSNVNAQVMLMPATAGAMPIALPALNNGNSSTYTNSWPRFAPTVQMYKGHQLVWVTFSSTRDYGDKVRNSVMINNGMGLVPQVNCYPSESPENPNGSKTQPLAPNCHQPQIWMASIDLTAAASGTGDPSTPAFWLPFQDVTAHNHIAQWVITIVGNSGNPDGGSGQCIPLGSSCTAGAFCCGSVCSSGTCAIP